MGLAMSLSCPMSRKDDSSRALRGDSRKRQKLSQVSDEYNLRLIPNLPDELSFQILARLPRISYLSLKLVSRKWKEALMSPEVYNLRKELGRTEEWLYVLTKVEEDKLLWHALDPLSGRWQRLPPMPNVVYDEEPKKGLSWYSVRSMVAPGSRIAEFIRGWLCKRDSSDHMPYCGCAVGAVDGCLYVLGGFSRSSTMRNVWRFDPILNEWREVSSMTEGRAYCKAGTLNNKLYIVGGVNRGREGLSPLQSAEVYDPQTDYWSQVPSMPFSKAQVLPNAFLADILKPIATGMTSYMGRLCVPQSLYSWPFFVDIGGEIYDPEMNSWGKMPTGMGEGWPARQAGTKLSVVVDSELYAFDPSSSMDSGKIKVYDQKEDAWKVVIGEVPIHAFTDSETPYLLAGFHGKLHIISRDAKNNITVLRADLREDLCTFSSSLPPASRSSLGENPNAVAETETVVWKVLASRDFGLAELVSCQVLDI